jgi:hypothetical protein
VEGLVRFVSWQGRLVSFAFGCIVCISLQVCLWSSRHVSSPILSSCLRPKLSQCSIMSAQMTERHSLGQSRHCILSWSVVSCFVGSYYMISSLGGSSCLFLLIALPSSLNSQSRSSMVSILTSGSKQTFETLGRHAHFSMVIGCDPSVCPSSFALLCSSSVADVAAVVLCRFFDGFGDVGSVLCESCSKLSAIACMFSSSVVCASVLISSLCGPMPPSLISVCLYVLDKPREPSACHLPSCTLSWERRTFGFVVDG